MVSIWSESQVAYYSFFAFPGLTNVTDEWNWNNTVSSYISTEYCYVISSLTFLYRVWLHHLFIFCNGFKTCCCVFSRTITLFLRYYVALTLALIFG